MWTQTRPKSYSICNSTLLPKSKFSLSVYEAYCPYCSKIFDLNKPNSVHKDHSNEDTFSWEYNHECGATLLIIND